MGKNRDTIFEYTGHGAWLFEDGWVARVLVEDDGIKEIAGLEAAQTIGYAARVLSEMEDDTRSARCG